MNNKLTQEKLLEKIVAKENTISINKNTLFQYDQKLKTAYIATEYENILKIKNASKKQELEIVIYNKLGLESMTIPQNTKIQRQPSQRYKLSLDNFIYQKEITVSATMQAIKL